MRSTRYFRLAGALLALLALGALFLVPARLTTHAAQTHARATGRALAATSIGANVYLTNGMVQTLFQNDISRQVPQTVGHAITNAVNQLPKQDQGWATQMANALLQPSAALVSLTPTQNGLLTTLQVDLYAGDPKPTTVSLLIGFSVANPNSIQVTALPAPNGGPSLVSGPLTTFQVPIGSLNSIHATPSCGDADLGINLNFPVTLGQTGHAPTQNTTGRTIGQVMSQPEASSVTLASVSASTTPDAYIEIPSASLAQLGGGIGSIPVSASLTAQNIQVSVSGSDLSTTSDIYWHGINIGTAVSTMAPGAANGSMVVHVTNTTMNLFGFISFPVNKYNQQIEQMLNAKLNSALTGTFTVTQAAIGSDPHLPCAAADSLILGGTIGLG